MGRPNPVLIDLKQPIQHCSQQLAHALDLAADWQLYSFFRLLSLGNNDQKHCALEPPSGKMDSHLCILTYCLGTAGVAHAAFDRAVTGRSRLGLRLAPRASGKKPGQFLSLPLGTPLCPSPYNKPSTLVHVALHDYRLVRLWVDCPTQ